MENRARHRIAAFILALCSLLGPAHLVTEAGPAQEEQKGAAPKKGTTEEKEGNGEKKENGKGKDKEKKEDPPKHILDNSFLIEEAYNQEEGVCQHVFNWLGTLTRQRGLHHKDFLFNYTLEIPLGSEEHQFSFTPMAFQSFSERSTFGPREEQGGLGDLMLNYRYQLLKDEEGTWQPAVAPRFSLILPTGDENRGLGTGQLGYQCNLPVSKQLEPFAFHFNAGFTYTPHVSTELFPGWRSPGINLHSYNLGGSVIYLASYEVNFLLECVAFFNEDLDDTGRRTRSTEIILNPGVRWAVYTDESVQCVLGVGVPLGLSKDAPDYGIFGYLSVEHAFKKKKQNESNGNGD
jgi:hypothetical protein